VMVHSGCSFLSSLHDQFTLSVFGHDGGVSRFPFLGQTR